MTIIIDDAGSGDLLFGVVISAYREETCEFVYDIVDVSYYQSPKFRQKAYLNQTSKIIFNLLNKLKIGILEPIHICRGSIFDKALVDIKYTYGEDRVQRIKVINEPQRLTETAYLDEIRNLGYEPLEEREQKRAKSFFHMMRWLQENPGMLKYAKTGWPRLTRYRLFRSLIQTREKRRA